MRQHVGNPDNPGSSNN